VSIGSGQHIWIRMWNDDAGGDDAIIADGVLEPGADVHWQFEEPQTVTRVSLQRISHREAEELAAEKGIKQQLVGMESARAVAEAWDRNSAEARSLGRLAEAADAAGDALFNTLNKAASYCDSERAAATLRAWR